MLRNCCPHLERLWRCVVTTVLLCGCGDPSPPVERAEGRALAAIACVRCHALPSPGFLPSEEWPYLLAWMGSYLGQPSEIELHPVLVNTNLVPAQPLFTRAQFDAIRRYFLDESAIQYRQPEPAVKPPVSPLFDPLPFDLRVPVISMVAIDSTDQTLLVGSSNPPGLLVLRRGRTTSIEVPSEPVSYERVGSARRLALLGHLAYDAREGRVLTSILAVKFRRFLWTAIRASLPIAPRTSTAMEAMICSYAVLVNSQRAGEVYGGAGRRRLRNRCSSRNRARSGATPPISTKTETLT